MRSGRSGPPSPSPSCCSPPGRSDRRGTERSRPRRRGASPRLLNELLGTHDIQGLGVNVRIGDGPVYPVVNVAIITALAFGLSPYLVRPLRRIFAVVILLVCASAMYLGAGFPADVLGGLLIGFAVAALVRVVFGSPGGQPSIAEVRSALVDLGYDVASIAPATAAHLPRVRDGRRARDRRALPGRRVRSRPTRRTHRRQGLAPRDVPRPRRPRVRQPHPTGRAHRLHADARRTRRRARGAPRPHRRRRRRRRRPRHHVHPQAAPLGALDPERVTDAVLAARVAAARPAARGWHRPREPRRAACARRRRR